MVTDPEPYVEIFGQLGSISAVLGGFAFAAAGALLAAIGEARSRAGSTAIGCAVLSACWFVSLGASGWLHSRRLGLFTSGLAVVSTIAAAVIMVQFFV